jgi:hypothetical protein
MGGGGSGGGGASLPDQTGNSGNFLTTNGSSASWSNTTAFATFNYTTLTSNLTVGVGVSAVSVGPINISNGIFITVASGQKWVVL